VASWIIWKYFIPRISAYNNWVANRNANLVIEKLAQHDLLFEEILKRLPNEICLYFLSHNIAVKALPRKLLEKVGMSKIGKISTFRRIVYYPDYNEDSHQPVCDYWFIISWHISDIPGLLHCQAGTSVIYIL